MQNSIENRQQNRQQNVGGINERALFITILIVSLLYNCYLNWDKISNKELLQKKSQSQLDDALKEIELYKADQRKLGEMFSLKYILYRAINSEPKIRFASNEQLGEKYVKIIKNVLNQPIYHCQRDIPSSEYDAYKNCFREMAIEIHNSLERTSPENQFIVNAGRVHYSFMITTTRSEREEFFITFEDIVFEILQYNNVINDKKLENSNDNKISIESRKTDDKTIVYDSKDVIEKTTQTATKSSVKEEANEKEADKRETVEKEADGKTKTETITKTIVKSSQILQNEKENQLQIDAKNKMSKNEKQENGEKSEEKKAIEKQNTEKEDFVNSKENVFEEENVPKQKKS